METQNKHNSVTLFVKVAAKAESQDKAKSALLDDVHGAWTESGNLKMELYEANNQPNSFYLFERWQDQASLENHFKQPYTTAAFDLQANDLTDPIEMNYLVDLWPLKEDLKKQEHRALTTLIVPFEVSPGNGEKLVELFEKFVPIVRQERGNVEFHFHKVIGDDNLFVLYERWEKQEDLDHHNTQQTTIELVNKVGSLLKGTVLDSILFATDISKEH
ncbi:putative quinol monooxygenase [Flavobacterium terrisoli]|uniref:putative quinol monooxygenase n=1 Tax=Flavobacterium terrisoli TaxID=3242195 RepID=UPI002542810B|nr:antibiotic biosynthesis monooxygenase [Flavobacterium buctense]